MCLEEGGFRCTAPDCGWSTVSKSEATARWHGHDKHHDRSVTIVEVHTRQRDQPPDMLRQRDLERSRRVSHFRVVSLIHQKGNFYPSVEMTRQPTARLCQIITLPPTRQKKRL